MQQLATDRADLITAIIVVFCIRRRGDVFRSCGARGLGIGTFLWLEHCGSEPIHLQSPHRAFRDDSSREASKGEPQGRGGR
jgi:hypothetical protein